MSSFVGILVAVFMLDAVHSQGMYGWNPYTYGTIPYGMGMGNMFQYGFNQYPQFQYPQFYGGNNYGLGGLPYSPGATVTTAQTQTVPGAGVGMIAPMRESTMVETVTPNQGVAVITQQPGMTQGILPQVVYQPASSIVSQPPAVVQSSTVVEVDNANASPGHFEFYQYGRDGLDSEGRLLVPGIPSPFIPEQPQRRIQRPFTVNNPSHYEIYKYGRSDSEQKS